MNPPSLSSIRLIFRLCGKIFHFGQILVIAIITLTPALLRSNEDQTINQFISLRQDFDRLLKGKTNQNEIDTLCEQYLNRLSKIKTTSLELADLTSLINAEAERTQKVNKNYLSKPDSFARIRLDSQWIKGTQYAEAANDFRTALNAKPRKTTPFHRPDLQANFGGNANLLGLPYLSPLKDFIKSIGGGINGLKSLNNRTQIGMPGFPKASFYYHGFDGNFSAHASELVKLAKIYGFETYDNAFNRMYVITDEWDQVVGLQFTSERPRSYIGHKTACSVFNFVEFRRKASTKAWVTYTDKSLIEQIRERNEGPPQINYDQLRLKEAEQRLRAAEESLARLVSGDASNNTDGIHSSIKSEEEKRLRLSQMTPEQARTREAEERLRQERLAAIKEHERLTRESSRKQLEIIIERARGDVEQARKRCETSEKRNRLPVIIGSSLIVDGDPKETNILVLPWPTYQLIETVLSHNTLR